MQRLEGVHRIARVSRIAPRGGGASRHRNFVSMAFLLKRSVHLECIRLLRNKLSIDWITTASDGCCPCHVSQNSRRHNDMACRRLTTSVTSSDHACRRYTRCGSCARTACVTRRRRPSSGQSPSPSCSMHPVPGLGSPKRLTGSESTVSSVAASAVVARHSYICRTVCHCRWTIIQQHLP